MSFLNYAPTFLISMPGVTEWLIIAGAVLILFGGRKIPEFMKGLGKGIREFNDAKNNVKSELEEGIKNQPNHSNEATPSALKGRKKIANKT